MTLIVIPIVIPIKFKRTSSQADLNPGRKSSQTNQVQKNSQMDLNLRVFNYYQFCEDINSAFTYKDIDTNPLARIEVR